MVATSQAYGWRVAGFRFSFLVILYFRPEGAGASVLVGYLSGGDNLVVGGFVLVLESIIVEL